MPSRPAAVSTEWRTSSASAKYSPLSTRKTTRPGGTGSPGGAGGRRTARPRPARGPARPRWAEGRSGDEAVTWNGTTVTLSAMLGLGLGEYRLHGLDVAK